MNDISIIDLIGCFKGGAVNKDELLAIARSVDETQKNRRALERLLAKALVEFREEKTKHDEGMKVLQGRCQHPSGLTKHHSDPAGGSDSFTECLVCGKQW